MILADNCDAHPAQSGILDGHAEQRVFVVMVARSEGVLMQDHRRLWLALVLCRLIQCLDELWKIFLDGGSLHRDALLLFPGRRRRTVYAHYQILRVCHV